MLTIRKKVLNIIKPYAIPIFRLYLNMETKKKINKLIKIKKEILLEIGAGDRKGKNGWMTLDIDRGCDLTWDLRNGIPFPNDSISTIYSSHLFEHLCFNEIVELLSECKRVLKKNGIFSICVPNARLYIEAYSNKKNDFWNMKQSYYKPAFNNTASRIDTLNYIAYMGGEHKFMFDEENLVNILSLNEFRNVKIRIFNSDLDLLARDYESIYAEGIK